jgi:hypothetical protein
MLARLIDPAFFQMGVQKASISLTRKGIIIDLTQQLMLNFIKIAFSQSENQKYSGFINPNICGLNYLCLAEKAYYSKYPDQFNYNSSFSARNCNFLI